MAEDGTALALPTPQAVAEWGQEKRQLLARSHSFELLGNGAPAEEVREAITDEVRASLPAAIAGWEVEARPATTGAEIEGLMAELGRYIGLTGTSMTYDARQEWIGLAAAELAGMPMSLVLPAIVEARRRVPWPNKLVSTICDKIDDRAARLAAEGDKLRRLAELA